MYSKAKTTKINGHQIPEVINNPGFVVVVVVLTLQCKLITAINV